MGFLKRLAAEPLKEIQAVIRSNDIAKEQMLFEKGESNPDALEDLRSHIALSAKASRQVVLHDLIEKRYSLRPYGWPDDEVLLLDGAQIPTGVVIASNTTPAKRRKVIVVKQQTADPKAVSNARTSARHCSPRWGRTARRGWSRT
ncbi:Uncharacterized protein (Fragment) OS=delta proteobacterium NaphS2 GN=NPH_3741 PE=4 SV=1 [Gemmata massiliana]|uniref:Probable ATP-binding protein BrxC winged helix-turn-helix domain-containing protein n=1 Tax=Gemmata massiliana TaxID=1210884 RepID=A0A6P2D5F6_9BACT